MILQRVEHGFRAVADAQFGQDAGDVIPDRAVSNSQRLGNLAIADTAHASVALPRHPMEIRGRYPPDLFTQIGRNSLNRDFRVGLSGFG